MGRTVLYLEQNGKDSYDFTFMIYVPLLRQFTLDSFVLRSFVLGPPGTTFTSLSRFFFLRSILDISLMYVKSLIELCFYNK